MTHRDIPLLSAQQLAALHAQPEPAPRTDDAFARHQAYTLAMLESFITTATQEPMPACAKDPKERLGF